jgi:glycosyltransferase involved in cell wall biosynthesis
MARVLLVGRGHPERGGIPTFLALLQSGPLADAHDLTFLNLAEAVDVQGGRASGANVVRAARDTWRVWQAAKGQDVVHVHSALAPAVTMVRAGLLAAAGRSRGSQVVVHAHGGRVQLFLTSPARRRFARAALAAVTRVAAVSEGAYDALVAVLGDRVLLVENGVDVARFTPLATGHAGDDGPVRILYAGILTARKGVLDHLAASDRLAAEGMDHRIVLVGGTPDEGAAAGDEVVRAAEARADRVVLAGTRPPDEMPAAYRDADVFCLPSWWEAMPLTVLEAMASGLPVVASAVGDIPRIVDDDTTGLVVPARDVDALAAALRTLVEDADRRRSMGAAGRRRVEERWSADAMFRTIGDLYDRPRHSAP